MATKFIFDNKRWLHDVEEKRASKGVSLRQLSLGVGLSTTQTFRIVNGKIEPRMSDFIQICSMLNLEAIEYFDENEVQMRMF